MWQIFYVFNEFTDVYIKLKKNLALAEKMKIHIQVQLENLDEGREFVGIDRWILLPIL
jgi:hypothetical protein